MEIAAATRAYGNCVFTWENKSVPTDIDDKIVVSEIGEQ